MEVFEEYKACSLGTNANLKPGVRPTEVTCKKDPACVWDKNQNQKIGGCTTKNACEFADCMDYFTSSMMCAMKGGDSERCAAVPDKAKAASDMMAAQIAAAKAAAGCTTKIAGGVRSAKQCYVYEQNEHNDRGALVSLKTIATVTSCTSGCFKTESSVRSKKKKAGSSKTKKTTEKFFTGGCDTTGKCKGVADGGTKGEVFCCSGALCNGANARAIGHPLILLFALLLGSAAAWA